MPFLFFVFVVFQTLILTDSWADIGAPVYVSDQPRVTSEAMEYEIAQFKSRANYESIERLIQTASLKKDQSQKELDRAKSLAETGQLTDVQLQQAHQNFLNSEDALSRLQVDLEKNKTSSLVAKYRILEEGNVESDHRLAVANALKSSLTTELGAARSSLQNAKLNLQYFNTRFENGKILFNKDVISLLEYERRQLDLQSAQDRVNSLESQMTGIQDSMSALEKNRQRLARP